MQKIEIKYTANICCLRPGDVSIKTIINFDEVNLQIQREFEIF